MRIFSAVLATETNTFSPIYVDRRAFEASLYAPPGQHPETPTLCSAPITVGRRVTRELGWTLIEGTSAWADPAGLVNRHAYETLRDEILDQLRDAMPVDGVVLGLHGAMVADGYDDPEGDLLANIRSIVGSDRLICAELDPHSHLTTKRLEAADFFVAFKEFPHVDFVDRAEDLWRIAVARLQGRVNPVMSVFDPRMIDIFPTSQEPMRGFVDRLSKIEAADPQVLSLSIIHGFMAGDVPEMGTKVVVVTDGQSDKGDQLAKQIGMELFALRGTLMMPQVGVAQALDQAVSSSRKPVVVADMWDNPGGGTAGDGTIILSELLSRNLPNTAVGTIWDPVAVRACMAAGQGAKIALRFGAKSAPGTGDPIDATVSIERVVPGAEMRFGESRVPMGDSVWIKVRGIDVILNSTRSQSFDPSLFSVLGIDPEKRDILVIKSTNHFYNSFSQIAGRIIYCSAGSPYPNDPTKTSYRKAPRDIWPIVSDPHGLGQNPVQANDGAE